LAAADFGWAVERELNFSSRICASIRFGRARACSARVSLIVERQPPWPVGGCTEDGHARLEGSSTGPMVFRVKCWPLRVGKPGSSAVKRRARVGLQTPSPASRRDFICPTSSPTISELRLRVPGSANAPPGTLTPIRLGRPTARLRMGAPLRILLKDIERAVTADGQDNVNQTKGEN